MPLTQVCEALTREDGRVHVDLASEPHEDGAQLVAWRQLQRRPVAVEVPIDGMHEVGLGEARRLWWQGEIV